MSDTTKAKPDSRWAWGIAAFYCLFAASMLSLVFFCTTQRVDLVREDYYQAGVDHQSRIDAESRTLGLPAPPTAETDPDGNLVVVMPMPIESGSLHLYRPDNPARDQKIQLNTDGATTIPADQLSRGKYTVNLTWRANNQDYAVNIPYFAQ